MLVLHSHWQPPRSPAESGDVLFWAEAPDGTPPAWSRGRIAANPKPKEHPFCTPLNAVQWEKVLDALAEQAIFTAQLLAGNMPLEIEQAFKSAGVSLFPAKRSDLTTNCSCPDYANPCKHIAATHYILGERFDEDPFLLFRLRGRTQEQILQGLRQRRAGQESVTEDEEIEEPEDTIPLNETLDHFWEIGRSLETFAVAIRPPQIEMPLLKRLGDPAFVPAPGLQALLRPAFQSISRSAQDSAYSDEDM